MRDNYFMYVGNAYPHKNLNRLIEAVIRIKANLKIVSARSVFTKRLKNAIYGFENLIEILDFVEDKELDKLYKKSIAFVFPTLSEGFGLPPKEAIQSGTIALVSDIPVLREVYGDSVTYFDPLDVNSIVEALVWAKNLHHEQKIKKILYGQKFVKKYSWKKMAQETLNVYASVV